MTRARTRSGLSLEQRRAAAHEIGQTLYEKYLSLDYLAFTAYIYQPPQQRARVETYMAPDKLKALLFIDEFGDESPAVIYVWRDGQCHEYSRATGEAEFYDYEAEAPAGCVWLRVMRSETMAKYGCMLGALTATWVGPNAADYLLGRFFREKIASGEYLGRLERDRRLRQVVALEDPENGSVDVYYVSDEGFLAEWDTFDLRAELTIWLARERRYLGLTTEPSAEEDLWTMTAADR